ncbi:MAG: restriction endonuclease subunit S [Accumulibacter sp.]|jgi:type I restriction enzyme S subunit|uniref:restriction endonuclease subunit S n=1 Tax=Accumulibacter sp. TaxID=2053492 RepID=UPI002FC2C52B
MSLPDTWVAGRLGDVLGRVETKVDPQTSSTLSHFYVGLEHIESHTGRLLRAAEDVTEGSDILSIKTAFKKGDILYGKLRPNLNKVHLAEQDGICSTDIWALRASSEILPEFALHYLRSPAVHVRVSQSATGANLPRLPADSFDRIPIPLPTVLEQQRIVEVLRQGESIADLRKHAEAIVDKLAKQRFAEMFGHPAENPKGFHSLPFQDFGILDRGVSKHRPRDANHLIGGPYPFIQTGDVSNAGDWITTYQATYSEAGLAQSKLWPKGTLCITIAANIARAAILEFDACFPDSVVAFTPYEGICSEYVLYCLRFYQEFFEHRAPKSAQMNINLDTLRTLRMPMPPAPLQEEFSKFLHAVRLLNQTTTAQAEGHKELVDELRITAFTGELTTNWRNGHQEEIEQATMAREQVLRARGTKGFSRITVNALPAYPFVITRPTRSWLLAELSKFQQQVFYAFVSYAAHPLVADDPDTFAAFCADDALTEQLAGFSYSPDRIRRTLSQLAALGLIARITLPHINPLTLDRQYLQAFRPLRDDEHTQFADVEALRRPLSPAGEVGE